MEALHVYTDVIGQVMLGNAGVPEVARKDDSTAEGDDFLQGHARWHGQGFLLFMAEALQQVILGQLLDCVNDFVGMNQVHAKRVKGQDVEQFVEKGVIFVVIQRAKITFFSETLLKKSFCNRLRLLVSWF